MTSDIGILVHHSSRGLEDAKAFTEASCPAHTALRVWTKQNGCLPVPRDPASLQGQALGPGSERGIAPFLLWGCGFAEGFQSLGGPYIWGWARAHLRVEATQQVAGPLLCCLLGGQVQPAKIRPLQRLFRSILTVSAPQKPSGRVPLTHPETQVWYIPKPSEDKAYRLNACMFLLVQSSIWQMCLECLPCMGQVLWLIHSIRKIAFCPPEGRKTDM